MKSAVPVIVCLGNPPYDRHDTASHDNKALTGGWVRWGEEGEDGEDGESPIFQDFLDPVVAAGHGAHLKNVYNLYVYFWRWALWKVFEHDTARGPGVISFISASSYLDGDAFRGMREHLRRQCDDIWILDLGGEGRGTRKSDNVFAIRTPVAIAVAVREKDANVDTPATVRYARIEGTRAQKLAALDAISGFSTVTWQGCPAAWQAPFRPAGRGVYFDWPLLTDLMPWQQSGIKAERTWVISPEQETLHARWHALLQADLEERKGLFKDSPTGRKAKDSVTQLPPSNVQLSPVNSLKEGDPAPDITRFSFRSLDRQYIFCDARMLDRPGPSLWEVHDERQVYVTSLLRCLE